MIGDVTGRTVTASEGSSVAEYNNAVESSTKPSEDNSKQPETNPLPIIAGVAALAGIGGAGYYFMKKKR